MNRLDIHIAQAILPLFESFDQKSGSSCFHNEHHFEQRQRQSALTVHSKRLPNSEYGGRPIWTTSPLLTRQIETYILT